MLGDLVVFAHIKEKKNTRTGWIIVKYSTHLWVERGIYCIFVYEYFLHYEIYTERCAHPVHYFSYF